MTVFRFEMKRARRFDGRLRSALTLAAALAAVVPVGRTGAGFAQEVAKEPGHSGKTVRLLTVGNSFSMDATRYLGDLAAAGGHKLVHRQAVFGGASMAQHWEKVLRCEKDPHDKQAAYGKSSLKEMLLAERFDFVTIQQYSFISHDVSTYRPYARNLYDFIKKHAPQAKVLVHETWAYRCDDPRFARKAPKPGQPATQAAMYEGLRRAYRTVAADLGTRIIPVGDAFYLADTDPRWGFKPGPAVDLAAVKYPALPGQLHSLHVGWRWGKDKSGDARLQFDGHHASTAGQYLGACVFYEVLFAESVVGNPFAPKGLEAAYVRFLQETAHKAVEKSHSSINIGLQVRPTPKGTADYADDTDGRGESTSLRCLLSAKSV